MKILPGKQNNSLTLKGPSTQVANFLENFIYAHYYSFTNAHVKGHSQGAMAPQSSIDWIS